MEIKNKELISKTEIFSVTFIKNKIEYEAIIKSEYTEINQWSNNKIINILLNGNDIELNLTDKEKLKLQEVLNKTI